MIKRHNGTRSCSTKTQRGIRTVHEHRVRKSWVDEQFAVDNKEDNEFEDLLDDFGRVDGIFDGKNIWSKATKALLMTDPYSVTEDNDDINVGEDATKFDVAYIVGKKDTWCQTTESARTKSREPDIDHSVNYENMTHAAEDLVNQQTITQYASHVKDVET